MTEFAALLAERAAAYPDGHAVVELSPDGSRLVTTWSALADQVESAAGRLRSAATRHGEVVSCFPGRTDTATVLSMIGALAAEVPFFPMPSRPPDLANLLGLVEQVGCPVDAATARPLRSPTAVQRRGPSPTLVLATSGTTGARNVVAHTFGLTGSAAAGLRLLFDMAGWDAHQRQLLTLPCCHIAPVQAAVRAVVDGNSLVVAEPDATELLDVVAGERVNWLLTTPYHMAQALCGRRRGWDLSAVSAVLHTASWCPPGVKRAWLDLLGPDRLFEMYGNTEGAGTTFVDGRTWLARPGTVGKGYLTRVRIRDTDGRDLGPGEVGDVLMKTFQPGLELGERRLPRSGDGYVCVGDSGWCDADGYLYLKGRGVETVAHPTGTAWINDLESALLELTAVVDAAVVPRGDAQLDLTLVIAPGACCPRPTELERRMREVSGAWVTVSSVALVSRIERSAMGKRLRAGRSRRRG